VARHQCTMSEALDRMSRVSAKFGAEGQPVGQPGCVTVAACLFARPRFVTVRG